MPRYKLSWLGSAFGFALLGAGLIGRRALRRGPMPVVAVGTVLLIIGTVLLALGNRLSLMAVGGLLQGAGSSAFLVATPALIRLDQRTHRLALAVGISSLTGLIAPAAIALTDHVLSTGRVALMLPIVWLLPFLAPSSWRQTEQAAPAAVEPTPPTTGSMTADTWRRWTIIVLGVSAEFCFWTWGAARLVDGGATDAAASGLVAAFAVGMALGRFAGPRRYFSLSPILTAVVITSLAAVALATDANLAVLVSGLFVAGFGIAVIYPIALAVLLEDRGLSEARLISLAANASGVAITITPGFLGLLDRAMPIRYAFALVPILMACVGWLTHHDRPALDSGLSSATPQHR